MAKLGFGEYFVIAIVSGFIAFKFLGIFYTVGLFSIGLTAVYFYWRSKYQRLEKLGIPGPKPILIFGNFLDFPKNVSTFSFSK